MAAAAPQRRFTPPENDYSAYSNGSASRPTARTAQVQQRQQAAQPQYATLPNGNGQSLKTFAARAGELPMLANPSDVSRVDSDQDSPTIGRPENVANAASKRNMASSTSTRPRNQPQNPTSTKSAQNQLPAVRQVSTGKVKPTIIDPASQQMDVNREARAAPASNTTPGLPSSAKSLGLVAGDPNAWAAERSPLQRLEVKLNDMSKEDKRSRMQLAEQRLREKLGEEPISKVQARRIVSQDQRRVPEVANTSQRRVSEGNKPKSGLAIDTAPAALAAAATTAAVDRSMSLPKRRPSAKQPAAIETSTNDFSPTDIPTSRRSNIPPSALVRPSGERRRSSIDREVRFSSEPATHIDGQPASARKVPAPQQQLYAERMESEEDYDSEDSVGADENFSVVKPKAPDVPVSQEEFEARTKKFGGVFGSTKRREQQQQAQKPVNMGSKPIMNNVHMARLTLADMHAEEDHSHFFHLVEKPRHAEDHHDHSAVHELLKEHLGLDDAPVNAITEQFQPNLMLNCGPLLRYTGMEKSEDNEFWRGTVLIVTEDHLSDYSTVPTLRLFHQPEDLDRELPPDPVGGMPKLWRRGKNKFVKPVEDLNPFEDVSHKEDDEGLFESNRTAAVPTDYGLPDMRVPKRDPNASELESPSPQTGRSKTTSAVRLHSEQHMTFWRFHIEVELGDEQMRVAYSINNASSVGFWVPAKDQSMNIMFYSCNGFSLATNKEEFSGPDPLWRDVLNAHQVRPFHVMLGGGDQIYNDAVTIEVPEFREWLSTKNPHHKHVAEFTQKLQAELEDFYCHNYAKWFSTGLFSMANQQIPMVNIWDDHDIIDGYGSYPHKFMSSPVFSGLGSVAFKYYMLFQHHSLPSETQRDEPSWLLGAIPGPYISEFSRSIFMFLGRKIAVLGLDCRTERMRDQVLCNKTYNLIFERCRRELVAGETKHLIVLLGIPIAYPRLVWLENILTSRALDPVKALGRLGLLGSFMNKIDGGVEILDDLDDHWTAKHHKVERNLFIARLQALAAEKSVRVTILGGDVHLGAIGQFYSRKDLHIPKDRDHRYMPNVISSAIVNGPPPDYMADVLNKRDKVHHLDDKTDEDMIPMFTHDVDGVTKRNNKHLLPRRNWCSIAEYIPGGTPPPTPPLSDEEFHDEQYAEDEEDDTGRPVPQRRGSNSRPGGLMRVLSLTKRKDQPDISAPYRIEHPNQGYNATRPAPQPPNPLRSHGLSKDGTHNEEEYDEDEEEGEHDVDPPNSARPSFVRTPTALSEKAAKQGKLPTRSKDVSLQHGLDIALNCEVKQGDPSGHTESYRLLVPALWYDPQEEAEFAEAAEAEKAARGGLLSRMGSLRSRRGSQSAPIAAVNRASSQRQVGEDFDEADQPSKPGFLARLGSFRGGRRPSFAPGDDSAQFNAPRRSGSFKLRNSDKGQRPEVVYSLTPSPERPGLFSGPLRKFSLKRFSSAGKGDAARLGLVQRPQSNAYEDPGSQRQLQYQPQRHSVARPSYEEYVEPENPLPRKRASAASNAGTAQRRANGNGTAPTSARARSAVEPAQKTPDVRRNPDYVPGDEQPAYVTPTYERQYRDVRPGLPTGNSYRQSHMSYPGDTGHDEDEHGHDHAHHFGHDGTMSESWADEDEDEEELEEEEGEEHDEYDDDIDEDEYAAYLHPQHHPRASKFDQHGNSSFFGHGITASPGMVHSEAFQRR